MGQFIEGVERQQAVLLPECLDDYVDENSPVRSIDVFVEMLDLAELGFQTTPASTGRPGYHPGLMLQIYLYGYLNQIQSSRWLERECGRNMELIWLTGRLRPDFKTIADFRKDNGPAIRKVCQQFVALCRNINLLDGNLVAIDGSRFKAVNSKAKNYTRGKLRQKLGEIDKAIERYLGELDRADEVFEQTGTVLPEARMERTLRKLEHLQKEARRYRSIEKRMDETGETQVSLSDPDARSMATTPRMPRVVGYNVQTAVEAENHLIVAHEVTMQGYDRDALSMMAVAARDAMASDQIEAIADKGYYKSEEILACEEAGIAVVVPKPLTSNAGARGQFDKADFAYDTAADAYICPAGQQLIYRFTGQQDGKAIRTYWSSHCEGCVLKDKCTNSKERRIRRWEHEDVLERVQQCLDKDPTQLAVRSMTVEHPYGTIKSWMGATHFKMRRLKNVATEMALHVLAYNMTRVIKIMGIPALIAVMKA
ncbi:IS1182 family transposase [Rhodophyticola sp. CCM32]|uniref:IS1182 family transposase n=1 Tax=Rhodophyticola sp. CCM32 TaxID=2916397 RepID=UPI00107F49DD|nr:IS1182 family transposase [Rhodophyticola sp. CCM32]QBY00214.1 IS1182 family transposase [Rhodophyticola sp. CCM32]